MTEMQTSIAERLRGFLQEVRQELDFVVQKRGLYAAVVRNYVAIELKLLREDNFVMAMEKLRLAHRMITDAFAQDDPEDFYEALCAFDLGFFASSLWVYFDDDIEVMATQIWRARREFLPYLNEALRVAYLFSIYLNDGNKPRWAFYYALKTTNHMYLVFDSCSVYYNRCIGNILPEAVQNKLKQILYTYASERKRKEKPHE
jgi:hypothetical protein